MTLYELTNEFKNLLAIAEDPEVDPDAISDTMEGLTGEIEDKAEGYAIIIKELNAEAEKFNAEADRLMKYAKHLTDNADRMKERLLTSMDAIGMPKITTEHFKVSIVKNGGKEPLRITGEVPDDYMIAKPEPDKNKIREAIENGITLDFAHLEERGRHLVIR